MKTIKGPGIFLAQFIQDKAPFNSINGMAQWASELGYKGFQVPTWDSRMIDLDKAAESKSYCDDYKGVLADSNIQIIELASYLQGQLLAFHPAYAIGFQTFHPPGLAGESLTKWASEQLRKTIMASVKR